MPTESLLIVGAGGHALVVLDALEKAGQKARFQIQVRDGNPAKHMLNRLGYPVQVPEFPEQLPVSPCFFHLALGHFTHRFTLSERALLLDLLPLTIIHPLASVSAHADVGEGTFLAAQAVLAPHARVGMHVIVNHGAIVDHDVQVGDFVHLAPNVTLGGEVEIGRGSLIGAGAVVLPGCKIGDNCVVGAGSVVTRDLPSNSRVIGVPAKAYKD